MEKLKYILCFSILLFTACEDLRFGNDFLEMPPSNRVDLNVVYSCKENAEQALMTAYKALPDGLIAVNWNKKERLQSSLLESLTDINNTSSEWGSVEDSYYTGQFQASSSFDQHKINYVEGPTWSGVRAAWQFIENVDRVPDMTPKEKERRKAEAKTIIAVLYTELFRHYGGVPKVTKSYNPNDDFSMPRMTIEETVKFIVDLLDQAIPELDWSVSAEDDGRMTKAAAMVLKIRVLLFAASPLFNDDKPYMEGQASEEHLCWYGNKSQNRWQDVVVACEAFELELRKNGVYALVDTGNPRNDFRSASFNRGNGEVLISTRKYALYQSGSATIFNRTKFGVGNTTLDYVEMFQMTTGEDFDWDIPEHASYPFFDLAGNPVRDPRLYETVLIPNDDYLGRKAETWIGGRERKQLQHERDLCASGFCMRKFRQDAKIPIGQRYSWPYLRLAEFYLSYAEALNELDRTEEAYDYVKVVRARVDMPNFRAGLSKEEFREEILKERAREFAYEEVRYFDLVRWKRDDIFRKRLRGLDTRKSGNSFTYEIFEIPTKRVWQGDGWNPKWYLSPFPVSEINKKYGLVQNPGW